MNTSNGQLFPNVSLNSMGNNVSVIPYASIPEELKAKMKKAPSTRKKRYVSLIVSVCVRCALCADPTNFAQGQAYGVFSGPHLRR